MNGDHDFKLYFIFNTVRNATVGVRLQCPGYVYGNYFEGITNYAIESFGGTFTNVVENNTVVDSGAWLSRRTGGAGARMEIRNNLVVSPRTNWWQLIGAAYSNSVAANNILSTSITNHIWGSGSGTVYTDLATMEGAVSGASGNISTNQTLAYDGWLSGLGPAIDAGVTPTIPALFETEFGIAIDANGLGQELPWGTAWDAGWQEFTSKLPLSSGQRIVFGGDSITLAWMYGNDIGARLLLAHPDLVLRPTTMARSGSNIQGWTGDDGADPLYAEIIYPLEPNIVTWMSGFNETAWTAAKRQTNLIRLATDFIIASNAALPVIISPGPLDTATMGETPQSTFASDGVLIGWTNNWPAWNTWAALTNVWATYDIDGADTTHPGPGGHAMMSQSIWNGLRMRTNLAHLSVNAVTGLPYKTNLCLVSNAVVNAYSGVDFQRYDFAQPAPRYPESLVSDTYGWQEDLRYTLQVTGLDSGNYYLYVDDEYVETYSSAQLAATVNLATLTNGPWMDKATAVRTNLWNSDWVSITYPHTTIPGGVGEGARAIYNLGQTYYPGTNGPALIAFLEPYIEDLDDKIAGARTAATPQWLSFSIRSTGDTPPPVTTEAWRVHGQLSVGTMTVP